MIWRKRGRTILDTILFVFGSKAGRGGVGRGGGRAGTSKDKQDSRGRSEGLSSKAKLDAITAKSPGTFGRTVPSVNASSAGAGATRLFGAHPRFRLRKRMEKKE